MKLILTIGIMWSLLTTVVVAQEQVIPAIRLEEAVVLTPEENEKNIAICTQNLIKLGKSIEIYLEENGDYPEWIIQNGFQIFTIRNICRIQAC